MSVAARPDHVADALRARRSARRIASAAEVAAALDRMAEQVTNELAHDTPLVLAVMHGGGFVAAELCRRLDFPHEFDFVHATRYGDRLEGGALQWRVRPGVELAGRVVLIVDDVLDHGVTLAALREELERIGASKLYSAVLVCKDLQPAVERPRVDFVGMTTPDVYLFGCGMDYKGFWRGLTALYGLSSR